MQQGGDFVLCDIFEVLDVILKFIKIFTKAMTQKADISMFFFMGPHH